MKVSRISLPLLYALARRYAKTFLFLACTMLLTSSAFAHWRPSRFFWRDRTTSSRPSARDLRGIVESVDARRNTFTISDANGERIVVKRRDRRVEPQPGDFVSISGPWNRDTGFLEGYAVRLIEEGGSREPRAESAQ